MAYLPGRRGGGKLVAMTDGHEHHGNQSHGHEDHVHDASCAVAHGTARGPAEDKVLAAVFATPVASYLLRYGADAGYRAVLVEPDPERAKAVTADGFELAESLAAIDPDNTDVIITGPSSESCCATRSQRKPAGSASWATRGTRARMSLR
jgi:xanthine/CO dehydrogenase XdhC/CoxF family maturation factor